MDKLEGKFEDVVLNVKNVPYKNMECAQEEKKLPFPYAFFKKNMGIKIIILIFLFIFTAICVGITINLVSSYLEYRAYEYSMGDEHHNTHNYKNIKFLNAADYFV